MDTVDAFGYFWSAMVVIMTIVSVAWGINDLKTGSARLHLMGFGNRVDRDKEPFEFWFAVGSKFMMLPVGIFMLWFASDFFWK
ncbi:hypothetical protein [Pontixanthobacter aquaemixtae]|uniref:Uncharacterized protein n=1 Tax=Pontixanthobacter aquaemixtae TaxID=1958940 RepID=A0A844ZRU8_9SPHN|nr:hypothetical protein [Pontixanthobacter aquaemixtae]MXO90042.1 hypothetical protein [Pontixanthobacter aquaemixtae]